MPGNIGKYSHARLISLIRNYSESLTTHNNILIGGTTTFARASVHTFTGNDANATIPITETTANIDPDGGHRTGMRFAGAGTAGQILVVQNTGGENASFHNTEGTALLRGVNASHDTMEPNGTYVFISDGTYWNFIGGGITSEADKGLAAN
jgi:hypothetical protein